MGKPKSLKSSMKTIQEAISSFNRVAPICLQQSRTDSFRHNLYPDSSFNSVYYTHPSPSLSSSATTTSSSGHHHPPLAVPTLVNDTGNASTSSSCDNFVDDLPPPTGPINSRRFFFSPRTTKSIMEEDKPHLGHRRSKSWADPPRTTKSVMGAGSGGPCFCEESVRMVMSSEDPYGDFRTSMEAMVEAHGLRDWPELQQLLQCYLSLNDKKTHNTIMLAFVDILMHLLSSPENQHDNHSNSSVPCSSPLLQLCFN